MLQKTDIDNQKIENSANNLWGQVIYKLRVSSHTILHTACGDIRQVSLKDNQLTIYVQDDYLYNVLTKESNYKILQDILYQVNKNATLNIQKREKSKQNVEKDIFELKKKFGNLLNIK